VLAFTYALFFGYVAATYSGLPAKIASHFDFNGNPDGWMPRADCTGIMIAVAIIIPALVIGSMAGAARIPVSFINLPHRDYWLAPERRQSALAVLQRYSIWFAALNVLLLTGLQWLTVAANHRAGSHLDMTRFAALLALYLVGTVAWTVLLLRHFSKIP
jgi:uncharacterized membrane protein